MAQKIETIVPLEVTKKEKPEKAEKAQQVKAKKRGIDKWKKKTWYTILAPEEFERKPLGETISEKPELLIGRAVSITGRELANQPKKSHIYITFRVKDVSGNKAITEVIGHEIRDNYMRRVVKRRTSKIMSVKNSSSKDGKKFKVKAVIVTERKASRVQRTSISKITGEVIAKIIADLDSKKVIDELVFGNITNKIYNEIKRIVPIKRVEVTHSELLAQK